MQLMAENFGDAATYLKMVDGCVMMFRTCPVDDAVLEFGKDKNEERLC